MGYLSGYDTKDGVALDDIHRERQRQEELKEAGRFDFTCADVKDPKTGKRISNGHRLAILGEEYGEACRAMNEMEGANDKHGKDLRKELVQVAAVCVAWIEAIDKGA